MSCMWQAAGAPAEAAPHMAGDGGDGGVAWDPKTQKSLAKAAGLTEEEVEAIVVSHAGHNLVVVTRNRVCP